MLVLALDSATTVLSVAVVGGGRNPAERTTQSGPGEVAVALVDELLAAEGIAKDQLTHVAVGVGPGPYTSVRIGVMIALTVGTTLGIPVIGLCSLDAIARQAVGPARGDGPPTRFGVATDARRKEVYWAVYDGGGNRLAGPAVKKPDALLTDHPGLAWAGNGFDRYPGLVAEHRLATIAPSTPSAGTIGELLIEALAAGETPRAHRPHLGSHTGDGSGAIEPGAVLLAPYPLYLRRPDAVAPPSASGVSHG